MACMRLIRTEFGLLGGLIALPVAFLLIWLFNSYKMGKFGKPKPIGPTASTLIVFGIIVISIVFGLVVMNLLGINPR